MARVTRVNKSNIEHVCEVGRHTIPKGDAYLWAKPGFRGRKRFRCPEHPFKESDLATGMNAEPLAAREEFISTAEGLEPFDYDGLREAVETFQGALDDYVSVREEALDAWENGNSTLEELRDAAQEARDSFEPDVDEFTDDEPEDVDEPDDEPDEDEDPEAHEEWTRLNDAYQEYVTERDAWEDERDEHWENAVSEAIDAAQSVEL
jgi:hypothetical protein